MKTIESLLSEVSDLNGKYKKEAKRTGEKFNIFSILGVESKETSTHSAFLVELLNPKGSHPHGRGGLFLHLFLEMLKERFPNASIPSFVVKNATVAKEWHLGKINKEYTEGGRADIVINGQNGTVCIENKIYAGDQENQLIRYHNFYGENGMLLYLTLFGNDPSEDSIKIKEGEPLKKGKDYFIISYETDILTWLEKCQEAVKNSYEIEPDKQEGQILYEGIGQYIRLIKKLTRQSMNDNQKEEFFEIITKGKNPTTVLQINDGLRSFVKKVKSRLNYVRKELISSPCSYYKSSKIWDRTDHTKKLESVLDVYLNEVHGVSGVTLKIRLSPRGWQIELWNTKSIQVESFEKDSNEKRFICKRFPFKTKTEIVLIAVNEVTDNLKPGIQQTNP